MPRSRTLPALFESARACLAQKNPEAKCRAVEALVAAVDQGNYVFESDGPSPQPGEPGRPGRPVCVDPSRVPRRRLGSEAGRAALVHAVAHIEFNAINLALDAVCRFPDMPREFYLDWLSVARDEARHFNLLAERLQALGYDYGDFPAHEGLWQMAEKTAHSCLVRMALVPRVLEARGLDVTPGMIRRLEAVGDGETVAALSVILEEEVRHVAIGTRWYRYCCEREGLSPRETFLEHLKRYYGRLPQGPFNLEARYRAGFTQQEMDALAAGIEDSL
jgi:uncharacterized ferritin-like protein (DUF455 family)